MYCLQIHFGLFKQSANKHVFSAYYVQASILEQYRKYKEVKLLVIVLLRLPK